MIEISLQYQCECRDVFMVETEPPAGLPTHSPFPCVPDDPKYPCQTCTRNGHHCPGRENLYRPIEWSESGGVRRVIRMPRTGSIAWEADSGLSRSSQAGTVSETVTTTLNGEA